MRKVLTITALLAAFLATAMPAISHGGEVPLSSLDLSKSAKAGASHRGRMREPVPRGPHRNPGVRRIVHVGPKTPLPMSSATGRILVKLHAFARSPNSGILLFFLTLDQEAPHPALSPGRGNPSSPPLSCHMPPFSWRSAILLPSPGGEGRVRGLFPGIAEETEQQSETGPPKMDPAPIYPRLSLHSPRTTHVC